MNKIKVIINSSWNDKLDFPVTFYVGNVDSEVVIIDLKSDGTYAMTLSVDTAPPEKKKNSTIYHIDISELTGSQFLSFLEKQYRKLS